MRRFLINTNAWPFESTGLAENQTLPGLIGYEFDRIHDGTASCSDASIDSCGFFDPALGRYLRATVKIGAFCSYTPDPRLRVECEV